MLLRYGERGRQVEEDGQGMRVVGAGVTEGGGGGGYFVKVSRARTALHTKKLFPQNSFG